MCVAMQNLSAQTALPDAVKVPDGHKVVLETVGVGEITYECRDKAGRQARPSGFRRPQGRAQ